MFDTDFMLTFPQHQFLVEISRALGGSQPEQTEVNDKVGYRFVNNWQNEEGTQIGGYDIVFTKLGKINIYPYGRPAIHLLGFNHGASAITLEY